jgi:heme-degrading monooxygenase HmoA
MQARVVSLRVPPERVEEIESTYRDVLLPESEQQPGFSAMMILRNEETGETLELTLWTVRGKEGYLSGNWMN